MSKVITTKCDVCGREKTDDFIHVFQTKDYDLDLSRVVINRKVYIGVATTPNLQHVEDICPQCLQTILNKLQ